MRTLRYWLTRAGDAFMRALVGEDVIDREIKAERRRRT